jgi:hypothetical protein
MGWSSEEMEKEPEVTLGLIIPYYFISEVAASLIKHQRAVVT